MKNTKAIIALIILGFGMILFGGATFQVKETEQAIVLEFGEWKETVREAGIHFKVPFIQNVIFFDRRIRILDMQEMTVITADQKRMNVDAFAEYMIEDPLRVYQAVVNERGAENRLSTIANQICVKFSVSNCCKIL